MDAENYKEILDEVCEKLKALNNNEGADLSELKNSVEAIENLITDTQAKLNFQEIKDKLIKISDNIDNCNEAFIKNLYNDINDLKSSFNNIGTHLENIQNNQNLALTRAEFEEYQKHQIDSSLQNYDTISKELSEIKEKSGSASIENLGGLEAELKELHSKLLSYLEQFSQGLKNLPNIEEIKNILNNINNVQNKNISETDNILKDIQTGLTNFQEDIRNSDFANQISKISAIYDSMNIIQAWIEKAGYINKSIESLYSKLGEDINFNDISSKVDTIHKNISDINSLTGKIDNINSLIGESGENINKNLKGILEKLGNDADFDDLSEKIDIVYDNITALNSWAVKIDNIEKKLSGLDNLYENFQNIPEFKEKTEAIHYGISALTSKLESLNDDFQSFADIKKLISSLSEDVDITEIENKIDIIYENISSLNTWAGKIDNISNKLDILDDTDTNSLIARVNDIHNIVHNINSSINSDNFISLDAKLDNIYQKISVLDDFDTDTLFSQIDLIYENIMFLNNFAKKIDNINEKIDNINVKFDSINSQIETLDNKSKDKDNKIISKVETINTDLIKTGEILNTSLLDLEADFNKLQKFLDENTKITSSDIFSLKKYFKELTEDISSISIRTNKLILGADDANKEFKNYLEIFKTTIDNFNNQKQDQDTELKFAILGEKLNSLNLLMQNSVKANKNLNNAFAYLAEWIDASGNVLNSLQTDITSIKSQAEAANSEEIISLKNDISDVTKKIDSLVSNLSAVNDIEETSDIKSLISGISVQLNTSLSPNIDLLNEKIDKITEDNNSRLKEFEDFINKKFEIQNKQIKILSDNIENLNKKFDTLINVFAEDNKEYDMKDMLSYLVSEISSVSEIVKNRKNDDEIIKKLEEKVSSFDKNINKIVSYIEED